MEGERTFDPDRLAELVRDHLFAGPGDGPDPEGFALAVGNHPELRSPLALYQLTVWRKQQQVILSPYQIAERLSQLVEALAAECDLPLPDERKVDSAVVSQILAPLRRAPDETHDPTYLIFLAETARGVLYDGLDDATTVLAATMTDAAELLVLSDLQLAFTYVSDLLGTLDALQTSEGRDPDDGRLGNELALRAGLLRGWAHRGTGVDDPDALVDRIEAISSALLSRVGRDGGRAAELVPALVHLSIQLQETHRASASALVNRAALACGALAHALGPPPPEASVNLVGYLYDCFERTGDPAPVAEAVEIGRKAAADAGARVDLPILQLHSNLAHVLRHQARLHANANDRQLARQELDEAVRHAAHAVDHAQDQPTIQRATFLLCLAVALHERGTLFDRPIDLLGVTVRSEEAVSELAAEPDDPYVLQTRAQLLMIASTARRHLTGAGSAEPLAREAHAGAKGKKERIITAKELAHVLGELGEHREAERLLREAMTEADAIVAEANAPIDVRASVRLLADLPADMAIELVDQGAPEDAVMVLDSVRPWYRRLAGGHVEEPPPAGRAGPRLYLGVGRRGSVGILADGDHTVKRTGHVDLGTLDAAFTRFHRTEQQWANALADGADLATHIARFAGEVERLCEVAGHIVEPFASLLEGEELTIVPSGPAAGLPWTAAMADGVPLFADTDVTVSLGSPAERHHEPVDPPEIVEAYWPPSLRSDRPMVSSAPVRSVTPADMDGLLRVLGTEPVGALHLVCHGTYDPANPLQSFLAVAPDPSGSSGGGQLTLDELARHPVRTPIINLMACRTGAPDHQLFDQGLSFPSALVARGAASVLAPLWSLHLEVAEVFSRAFFAELVQGVPSARAFRLGIEATRAAARRDRPELTGVSAARLQSERAADALPSSDHPYWWAAMTHVGASVRACPPGPRSGAARP